ncbi:MAG: malto-oligosyltrehalose trehalohydrolase [Rhodothermales bacterium]|nr:malto-oligosyltrehalose trehalohydrolase [Rhodothermales bacterium]
MPLSDFGALPHDGGTRFRLWSPHAGRVDLVLDGQAEPVPMERSEGGLFEVTRPGVGPGARYRYRLDGDAFPDPASRFQPEGVHGPSQVVDPGAFAWSDAGWEPPTQRDLVFYELHVGTFTPEGTFDAAAERLAYLRDLGVTAVELMPVADFPGRWNWGYDPAALYAPSRAYGRPDDFRRLVDEAHRLGLAVFLDVIYNHLGPDGAYAAAFMPMFTEKHHTPWGAAVNLDDAHSEGVRAFLLDNALHWLREYHLDGLRLDATHALVDDSPVHFLQELSEAVDALAPDRYLIAEDHRNLNRLVRPRPEGYGLDGVWADDLHHQVRNLTAGDTAGYYASFADTTAADLAETLRRGWFYDGRPDRATGEPRGTSADRVRPEQCVVCIQNHDQVGNRPLGDRLSDDVPPAAFRAATAVLLFAPELPLLFMGQEWAASAPFQFFTDHNDELGPSVTAGRKEEFKDFAGFRGEVPDPQDPATFQRSKLDWTEIQRPEHAAVLALYRRLLALRRDLPHDDVEAEPRGAHALTLQRGPYRLLVAFDAAEVPVPDGAEVLLHTEEPAYTQHPRPPEFDDDCVRFRRAGAVVVRRP